MSPQIDYPEIAEGIMPRHRFMSAYEQRIEPPDRRWQYLLMAAEPYETIAFKVVPTGSPDAPRCAERPVAGPPACSTGVPSVGPCLWKAGKGREGWGLGVLRSGALSHKRPSWPGCSGIP